MMDLTYHFYSHFHKKIVPHLQILLPPLFFFTKNPYKNFKFIKNLVFTFQNTQIYIFQIKSQFFYKKNFKYNCKKKFISVATQIWSEGQLSRHYNFFKVRSGLLLFSFCPRVFTPKSRARDFHKLLPIDITNLRNP